MAKRARWFGFFNIYIGLRNFPKEGWKHSQRFIDRHANEKGFLKNKLKIGRKGGKFDKYYKGK